jgi:hypothetical protein
MTWDHDKITNFSDEEDAGPFPKGAEGRTDYRKFFYTVNFLSNVTAVDYYCS